MRKLLILIVTMWLLVGCEGFFETTPYNHLKRGTDKLDSWQIDYDIAHLNISSEASNHNSENKRIFINIKEDEIQVNIELSYWDGPKNFISITGIIISYYDETYAVFISLNAKPNIFTVDWEDLYEELYQPNMDAESLYDVLLEIKIRDIQRLFDVNDIEY